MVRHLANAIGVCRRCSDAHAPGTILLWQTLLCLVAPMEEFRKAAEAQEFLSTHIITIVSDREGVAVCTQLGKQVNVNVVVPKPGGDVMTLLAEVIHQMTKMVQGCVVNLRPVGTHSAYYSEDAICFDRFVSDPIDIADIVLDRRYDMLRLQGREQPVERFLHSPQEVAAYRPLATLKPDDPDDVLFWLKTTCGRLVVLRNPRYVLKTWTLPPVVKGGTCIPGQIDRGVGTMIESLKEDTLFLRAQAFCAKWVPGCIRAFYVKMAVQDFLITDELIDHVGCAWNDEVDSHTNLVADLRNMHHLMSYAGKTTPMCVADGLVRAMKVVTTPQLWWHWASRSPFLWSTLAVMPLVATVHMCSCQVFRDVLAAVLESRKGAWTALEVKKAAFLSTHSNAPEWIPVELERLEARATEAREETLLREWRDTKDGKEEEQGKKKGSPVKKAKRRRKKTSPSQKTHATAPEAEEEEEVATAATIEGVHELATHEALVGRLKATLLDDAWTCELIGSGLFFAASDADVVIGVEDVATLEEAYERVAARTGWHRCYDAIGEHVAILRGTFDGVRIDAQVRRTSGGDDTGGDTPAERQTRSALALTHALTCHTDAASRRDVRALHEWARVAGVKDAALCRLPGVAVTLTAVVLGCARHRDDATSSTAPALTPLLHAWRAAMTHEAPCVDLDRQTMTTRGQQRPAKPAAVRAHDANVASRLTVGTTRFLLDMLAHATSLADPLDPRAYAAWRARHLVRCVRVRPREGARTIARLLPSVLARLDGHPLLDAVHVTRDDDDEGTTLTVWASLQASADADVYGFREADEVSDATATGVVTVARRGRRWSLLATRRGDGGRNGEQGEDDAGKARVTDLRRVGGDGWVVPNAPYLTVDVGACFSPADWECV